MDDAGADLEYFAGPDEVAATAKRVWSEELPDKWMVITRDLYGDFGACTIESLTLAAEAGEAALFDHLYFAQSQKDFELIKSLP